ncbi:MAG: helix-turn-helix transcriptional regulator [Spirochaetales bacterium]|nr:helix-turn-helix transcriptional regulator [Spirochaetales bacterium]MCF7938937.1 helix-turn-helix transcriptional regulator [Spirochaetales bacterium]
MSLSEYYLSFLIPGWNIPPQSPTILSIWSGAMFYAIWKYGFLRISPGHLSEKILDSVEDLVILYSINGKVVYRNRKAVEVFGAPKLAPAPTTAAGSPLVFQETDTGRVESAIEEKAVYPLLGDKESWVPDYPDKQLCLRFQSAESHKEAKHLTINFRVKPLLDRFNDPLGVLVSGSVVSEFTDLIESYRFTKREMEVIDHLLSGCTIETTAESLYITERTVKAHITSIYEKTGASNRVELVNILSSEDGERSVEK